MSMLPTLLAQILHTGMWCVYIYIHIHSSSASTRQVGITDITRNGGCTFFIEIALEFDYASDPPASSRSWGFASSLSPASFFGRSGTQFGSLAYSNSCHKQDWPLRDASWGGGYLETGGVFRTFIVALWFAQNHETSHCHWKVYQILVADLLVCFLLNLSWF